MHNDGGGHPSLSVSGTHHARQQHHAHQNGQNHAHHSVTMHTGRQAHSLARRTPNAQRLTPHRRTAARLLSTAKFGQWDRRS